MSTVSMAPLPIIHESKPSFEGKIQTKNPSQVLKEKSLKSGISIDSLEFAQILDQEDKLSTFRDLFVIPLKKDLPHVEVDKLSQGNEPCLYMCGQSLGLKPKSADCYSREVLTSWGKYGVHSHFNGFLAAASADTPPKEPMSRIVGAKETEVAIMGSLTANLHILFSTFYRPTEERYKIIIEQHAFSSDMYVVKSQLIAHGYCPETDLIVLKPRTGEYLIREEDTIRTIESEGDSVAVMLLPGIQYYTGQLFNIPKLTAIAHKKGIIVGCDLAHAAGNVTLNLHDWKVDFAAWCTYKYLNSGAGGIAAIFIHESYTKDGGNETFPMLKGWWGNAVKSKFLMREEFEPSQGADMMKLSNPPAILCALLMASLDIFNQTTMTEIGEKQFLLTGYLEYLLKKHFIDNRNENLSISNVFANGVVNGYSNGVLNGHSNGVANGHTNGTTNGHTNGTTNGHSNGTVNGHANGVNNGHSNGSTNKRNNQQQLPVVEIITPSDPKQRGSQLSLSFSVPLQLVQEEITKLGIVCDIRMPHVMRVAPAPLYNSFSDVYLFVHALKQVCYDLNGRLLQQK